MEAGEGFEKLDSRRTPFLRSKFYEKENSRFEWGSLQMGGGEGTGMWAGNMNSHWSK